MSTIPSVIRTKVVSFMLLVLTLLVPLTGLVAVRAYTTATTAACRGSNEAKQAVSDLVDVLIQRAEAPIINGTPEQLQRQTDSVVAYKAARQDADRLLAAESC